MTEQEYQDLKDIYIEHVSDLVRDMGTVYPHITVLAKSIDVEDTKPAIIHIPVPESLLDDEGKEEFVTEIIPEVFTEIKKKFVPLAVCWTSEAYLRSIGIEEEMPENYKDLPIQKEVVIVTIDRGDKEEAIIYDIIKNGKQVNQFGDMVDAVKLKAIPDFKEPTNLGGKFSKLFKKFKD